MVKLNLEIPEGWLEPEEKWGFQVTRQRKEIWAVELDLLHELDRVCKKHGLTFFADSGTMLGAIRHKGFIPWDDDIDVAMMRDEYEQLCKIAGEEFSYPYFFQTEYTDHGTLRGHAQLRNSMTTAVLKDENHTQYPFNQGIFIDIFPLDNAEADDERLDRQIEDAHKAMDLCYQAANVTDRACGRPRGNASPAREAAKVAMHLLLSGPLRPAMNSSFLFRRYEKVLQRYNGEDTPYVMNFRFTKRRRNREFYREAIDMPFEFITIPVMAGYDEMLTIQFGDYMKPVYGGNDHGDVIFRTDISYLEYFDRRRRKRERRKKENRR